MEKIDWDKLQQQDLFNPDDPALYEKEKPRKKKKPVDYEVLYQYLLQGPLSFHEIEVITGVAHCAVAQVITTLSLRYPVWSPKRGVYKLYTDEDYGTGINSSILDGEE